MVCVPAVPAAGHIGSHSVLSVLSVAGAWAHSGAFCIARVRLGPGRSPSRSREMLKAPRTTQNATDTAGSRNSRTNTSHETRQVVLAPRTGVADSWRSDGKVQALTEALAAAKEELNRKTNLLKVPKKSRRRKTDRGLVSLNGGYTCATKRNLGHAGAEALIAHLDTTICRQTVAKWELLLGANVLSESRESYGVDYKFLLQSQAENTTERTWEIHSVRGDATNSNVVHSCKGHVCELSSTFQHAAVAGHEKPMKGYSLCMAGARPFMLPCAFPQNGGLCCRTAVAKPKASCDDSIGIAVCTDHQLITHSQLASCFRP